MIRNHKINVGTSRIPQTKNQIKQRNLTEIERKKIRSNTHHPREMARRRDPERERSEKQQKKDRKKETERGDEEDW